MATKHSIMTITCMYCGESMGTKEGYGVKGDTSGICRKCWKERWPELPYPEDEKEEHEVTLHERDDEEFTKAMKVGEETQLKFNELGREMEKDIYDEVEGFRRYITLANRVRALGDAEGAEAFLKIADDEKRHLIHNIDVSAGMMGVPPGFPAEAAKKHEIKLLHKEITELNETLSAAAYQLTTAEIEAREEDIESLNQELEELRTEEAYEHYTGQPWHGPEFHAPGA